jgi:hypothetical protein
MDITALRKMRNNDFSKITGEFEKIANPSTETKSYKDDRVWKLEPDKAGNATAVIRFLPRSEGDELPWVRIFNHSFQGPTGKWYIENSLTTLNEKDPVGELNSRLWNSGSEANKEIARKQKRKLTYIANVLIVSDPKHPENEGKVMLFKFGKKIFDKIMDKARPTFEDEKPVNVFDLWEGADFKLRMRKVDGYANYDQSQFMEPSALFDGDEEKLLEVVSKQYKLSEFLDAKNFKSFDELAKKLADVLDETAPTRKAAAEMEDQDDYTPPAKFKAVESKPIASKPEPAMASASSEDDEDMMSYFQKIANEK